MFERFSDGSRRAIVWAQEEARGLADPHIGTEHLLLGLLHEPDSDGASARTLRRHRQTVSARRDRQRQPTRAGRGGIVTRTPSGPSAVRRRGPLADAGRGAGRSSADAGASCDARRVSVGSQRLADSRRTTERSASRSCAGHRRRQRARVLRRRRRRISRSWDRRPRSARVPSVASRCLGSRSCRIRPRRRSARRRDRWRCQTPRMRRHFCGLAAAGPAVETRDGPRSRARCSQPAPAADQLGQPRRCRIGAAAEPARSQVGRRDDSGSRRADCRRPLVERRQGGHRSRDSGGGCPWPDQAT